MLFTRQEFRPYQACVLDLVPFTLDRLNRQRRWARKRRMPHVLKQRDSYEGIVGVGSELVDVESSYHFYICTRDRDFRTPAFSNLNLVALLSEKDF